MCPPRPCSASARWSGSLSSGTAEAQLRLVRTGTTLHDQVEILAGLESGEQIAIPTKPALVDGQPVTVIP